VTWRPLIKPYLLKVAQPPNSTILGNKPLIYGRYSRSKYSTHVNFILEYKWDGESNLI
jgi:hypothetical protein